MSLDRIGLTETELSYLAMVSGREVEELGDELRRRPWALHDLLADPDVVHAVREPDSIDDGVPPFVLFAVFARLAADSLLDSHYVNDWMGPRSRLPVFDVEPVQEFVHAPARVIFVARLLASMVEPTPTVVPIGGSDLWELVRWLDAVEQADRVVLLLRLGDLALFLSGVFADAMGPEALDAVRAGEVAGSVGMTADEILTLIDPGSISPGLDALEQLGARWYQEARRSATTVPPIVEDVARRFHSARRFVTHLADSYLAPLESGWRVA